MYKLVYWFLIVNDSTDDKEDFLRHLSTLINVHVCKGHPSDFMSIKIYAIIMGILSVQYKREDTFKFIGLAPLLTVIEKWDHQ